MQSNNTKKKICLVQLTRIGDVIQTTQAAKQLRIDHPEAKLYLVARKSMAKGLEFILNDVFEKIFYIDVKEFIPSGNQTLKSALSETKVFLDSINVLNLDLLINLSFNKSSSYLASLVKAKFKMGLRRNEQNQIAIDDKWSQYIYASVMNSPLNPFNLVDIYKFIMGAKTYEPEYLETVRENVIVVHPFASAKKKRWGSNKWVDLIYKVLKDNPDYTIKVVGAKSDEKDASLIIDSPALSTFNDRLISHVGQFSIEQTYKAVEKAKLLICHDSMVSHLAAVSQTPTIVMSMGTVRPSETTPYQANVLNIAPRRGCFPCAMDTACDLLPCHKDISHQLVAQLTKAILEERTIDTEFFKNEVSPFHLNNASIFAPHFSETGLELIDITMAPHTAEDVFKTFYRIMWAFYIRNVDAAFPFPELGKEALSVLAEHQKGCGYIYELYSFGMKYSNAILEEAKKENPKIPKIQENINKLSEIDELCAVTKKTYPLLKPIVDFFFVNKANAIGNNIIDITQSNLLSFYDGQNLIKILYDLIEKMTGPSIKNGPQTEI